jgi:DNA polymerase-3 subunit alpha
MSSLLSIDDIISFSLINKQQYASLIDINTLHGAMEFYTKCQKNNLIPILGLQIVYQNHKYVLVPHNYEALKKIYKVSSLINLNKDYVLIDLLDNVSVIALDNFINQGIKSKCLNYYTVTSDNPLAVKENFCLNIADTSGLKILECLRESKLLANCKTNYSNAHMFNESEANNFFTQAALNNLNRLLATIKITIVDEKINFINYSNDSSNLLISMATEKLKLRLNNKIIPQIYLTRLENELSVINNMNFANYFLVVQDYVN